MLSSKKMFSYFTLYFQDPYVYSYLDRCRRCLIFGTELALGDYVVSAIG